MLALEITANIASSSAVGTPATVSPRSALRSIAVTDPTVRLPGSRPSLVPHEPAKRVPSPQCRPSYMYAKRQIRVHIRGRARGGVTNE